MGLWWSKVDVNEELNKHKRAVSKAIREVEKEIQKLEKEEVKLNREIRNAICKGYTEPAKIFSRDILKIRKQMEKLNLARSQLMGAELKLTSVRSQIQVNNVLGDLNSVMGKVNKLTELSSIQSILRSYAKEADKFDIKSEMINESVDLAFTNDTGFEGEDELVEQIYREVYDSIEQGRQKDNSNTNAVRSRDERGFNKNENSGDGTKRFESKTGEVRADPNINSIEERIRRLGESRSG